MAKAYNDQRHFDRNYQHCDIVYVPLSIQVPSSRIRRKLLLLFSKSQTIADFGCGHGSFLAEVAKHCSPKAKIFGVDYSEIAVKKALRYVPFSSLKVQQHDFSEGTPKGIGKLDLICTNQMVEHLPDDRGFLKLCERMLKPKGHLFVGTVHRKRWGWYFYKNAAGRWALEPTHLREYENPEDLLGPIRQAGFLIHDVAYSPIVYPVVDPALKFASRFIRTAWMFRFLNSSFTMFLRRYLVVPIPGYYSIQVLSQKKEP
jgi:2-polyprenyl-3-methyl-5-hydroxy-6-metoxy-1,4-benzoquinol methylase